MIAWEMAHFYKNQEEGLVGDMVWTRDNKWNVEMLHKLEKLTNHQRKNLTAKYVCQYDLGAFSRD